MIRSSDVIRGAIWAVVTAVIVFALGVSQLAGLLAWQFSGLSDTLLVGAGITVLFVASTYQAIRGHSGFVVGIFLVLSTVLGLSHFAIKSTSGTVVQRYAIIVEDKSGNSLGSGVWEMITNWERNVYRSEWRGEAFSIKDSNGEEFFVTGGLTEDVDNLFRSAGHVFPPQEGRSHVDRARMRWEYIRRLNERVPIPRNEVAPLVYSFSTNELGSAIRLARGKFNFFVQPTDAPLSSGLEKIFIWAKTDSNGAFANDVTTYTRDGEHRISPGGFKFGGRERVLTSRTMAD